MLSMADVFDKCEEAILKHHRRGNYSEQECPSTKEYGIQARLSLLILIILPENNLKYFLEKEWHWFLFFVIPPAYIEACVFMNSFIPADQWLRCPLASVVYNGWEPHETQGLTRFVPYKCSESLFYICLPVLPVTTLQGTVRECLRVLFQVAGPIPSRLLGDTDTVLTVKRWRLIGNVVRREEFLKYNC